MLDLTVLPVDQLLGLAQAAINQSDLDGGERALREVLRRHPRDAEATTNLAKVLLAKGARREAVTAARQAVALGPKSWRAQSVLAASLASMGQIEPSVRAYRAAATIEPNDPGLLVALGGMLERIRKVDEARALATRALEIDPAFGPAMNLLGQLATEDGDEEAAERWLLKAVTDSAQGDARAHAWHRLGSLREKQKRWDEAFQCHDRANRVVLSTPAARHMMGVSLYDHLDSQFQPGCEEMLARWASRTFKGGPPDPVFLVGFPRSGTTMTENVLGALPGTVTTDEEPVLVDALKMALQMCGNPHPDRLSEAFDALTLEQIQTLRSEYWKSVARLIGPEAPKARMLVDKTPLRFVQVLLLNVMFPQSRIVFVVRDPRDCCLSCFFQDFNVSPSLVKFTTLETTGDTYASVMRFWMRARTRITMPWMEVRYEDMVADFETHARRLVEFIGREWSDDVLRFNEKASGRAIRTPSYRAVTEKVNTRAVGKWARYEQHLGPLIERVRPFLEPLGYEE